MSIMKYLYLIGCLLFIAVPARALDSFKIDLSSDYWVTKGDFRMMGGPAAASNRWELTHPVDSNIPIWSMRISSQADNMPYYLSYSFGQSSIKDGTIRDTDWDASGVISDLSYSTSRGHFKMNITELGYRLTAPPSLHPANRPVFYFAMGYLNLTQSANYYDPTVTISSYNPSDISWSERWTRYNLTYSGNEWGIKGYSNFGAKFRFDMALNYLPALSANYDGVRYPERISPKIEQISATGHGSHYKMELLFQPTEHIACRVGYRYVRFWTKGEDDPGTAWAGSWEKLNTNLKGFSIGINVNF